MMKPLVITGLGTVLPCGEGPEQARECLAQSRPCFQDLPEGLSTWGQFRGAWVPKPSTQSVIPPMINRRLDRTSRFAWLAAFQAMGMAGVEPSNLGERTAMVMGSVLGGSEATEPFLIPYLDKGPAGASPMIFPNCVANAATGHLAIACGITGPSITQLGRENACFHALEQGWRWLEAGIVDRVLLLGSDALFPIQLKAMSEAGLSLSQGLPARGGKGVLPGEGAIALLLESEMQAERRGAPILGRLTRLRSSGLKSPSPQFRCGALLHLLQDLLEEAPVNRWIGGSDGHPLLDEPELALEAALGQQLPKGVFPRLFWGQPCAAGAPLLAAALLEPAHRCLITAPASFGASFVLMMEGIRGFQMAASDLSRPES